MTADKLYFGIAGAGIAGLLSELKLKLSIGISRFYSCHPLKEGGIQSNRIWYRDKNYHDLG
jgi:hypothetical protein